MYIFIVIHAIFYIVDIILDSFPGTLLTSLQHFVNWEHFRYVIRAEGLICLVAWFMMPYFPLAYFAMPIGFIMVAFELFHLNTAVLRSLSSKFEFWTLFANFCLFGIVGLFSVPLDSSHVWHSDYSLMLCTMLMIPTGFLRSMFQDSNLVVSVRYRMVLTVFGLIFSGSAIVFDLAGYPLFVVHTQVYTHMYIWGV